MDRHQRARQREKQKEIGERYIRFIYYKTLKALERKTLSHYKAKDLSEHVLKPAIDKIGYKFDFGKWFGQTYIWCYCPLFIPCKRSGSSWPSENTYERRMIRRLQIQILESYGYVF